MPQFGDSTDEALQQLKAELKALVRQLDAYLTEVDYEATELGNYDLAAISLARRRAQVLLETLWDEHSLLLNSLSFPGETERFRAWMKRALDARSKAASNDPATDDWDRLFPVGRAASEVRAQIVEWIKRLEHSRDEGKIPDRQAAPICFVSYCRLPEENSEWVCRLATFLQSECGIRVVIDLWDLWPGDDLERFMQQAIAGADCIAVVCTPEYKARADTGGGGVGWETGLIITWQTYHKIPAKRVIPVLKGESDDCAPAYLFGTFGLSFRDESQFEKRAEELAKAIYGIPLRPRPPQGRPLFNYGAAK